MPLHNLIPLCSFKYAGDTLGGANLIYDTSEFIAKEDAKYLINAESTDMNIVDQKSLNIHNKDMNIVTQRSFYSDHQTINIIDQKSLSSEKQNNINMNHSKLVYGDMVNGLFKNHNLLLTNVNPNDLIKSNAKLMSSNHKQMNVLSDKILSCNSDKIISVNDYKYLLNDPGALNKTSFKELDQFELKEIGIESMKDLYSDHELPLVIEEFKPLKTEYVKTINLNTDRSLSLDDRSIYIVNSKCINIDKLRCINKDRFKILIKLTISIINKINKTKLLYKLKRLKGTSITISTTNSLNKDTPLICKQSTTNLNGTVPRAINRFTDTTGLITDKLNFICKEFSKYSDRIVDYSIDTTDFNYLDVISQNLINKYHGSKLFYRNTLYGLDKYNGDKSLDRIVLHDLYKNRQKYFYRTKITRIFNTDQRYLNYTGLFDIFKNHEKLISREVLIPTFKIESNYLGYSALFDVYKTSHKSLNRLQLLDIFQGETKNIKDLGMKGIYKPSDSQYIEVFKRWWWLKETNPKDKLILPNKDYANMSDLLSNTDFEYLRYNNHPIEWGKSWGKDWNIPPYAVSVEIMLDLVNILIMIWHQNVEGWLSCTGKEGIQFVMELLYDWYTMDTSNPNESYKRAYRWIRWEAEKVYFKETSSGLQAIGMLIGNLLDYLRIHHFNVVPVWKKPVSMDQGRYFNKSAANNDLMKSLDKYKSNRHYMIETQNFEKKDTFRR